MFFERTTMRNFKMVFFSQKQGVANRRVSYEMIEKDIDISLKRFETIFNSIFNKSMKQKRCDERIIYCKHRLLLSDDWERICKKKIFGASSLTVLTARKHKVINETTSDEKIRSLSKNEQDLIVKEATDWVLNHINSYASFKRNTFTS